MAVDLTEIDTLRTFEGPLALGASFDESGQLLVQTFNSAGEAVYSPSAGTSGEVFRGFSQVDKDSDPQSTRNYNTSGVIPSSLSFNVGHTLITNDIDATNGDMRVFNVTNNAYMDVEAIAGTPTATNKVVIADAAAGDLEFHASDVGDEILVFVRVTMSAKEKEILYGQRFLNRGSQESLERMGWWGGEGKMSTDQFDPTITDWTGALTTGPNGIITIGGGGTALASKLTLRRAPTFENPFLQLWLNV